jgi:hypothetical protein
MDFQLKDSDGVVDRSARNEFQKVVTTGHDQRNALRYQLVADNIYMRH